MGTFLAEVTSWYWWISVVIVGLVINIASAYIKPLIDKWIANRSETKRAKRSVAAQVFEKDVAQLVSSPTRLLIAGQRLHSAQLAVLSVTTFLGFLIALGFFLDQASQSSMIRSVAQIVLALATTLISVLMLVFMRRESELDDRVRKARKLYESVAGDDGGLR